MTSVTEEMIEALKPCPRCGSKDIATHVEDGWYTVECWDCPCRTSGADRSNDAAIAAWNTRALEAALSPSPAAQTEPVAWMRPGDFARLKAGQFEAPTIWPQPEDGYTVPLYAAPSAPQPTEPVAVTAEAIMDALAKTEFHRSQIQGFFAEKAHVHYIRDCTKDHDQQIWSECGLDYDAIHARMMKRIELERWRIVLSALASPVAQQRNTCATDGCGKPGTERFEYGGVGSNYCPDCIAKIAALRALSPERKDQSNG